MDKFKLVSDYKLSGDQPEAVAKLVHGVDLGLREQVLLGVTGSGKTFTMASVIEKVNKPTLVLAHNKTLAAQLCSEFREFFPDNAVEYFISYYDYYQPEAYIAHTDTYIEKDASVNEEIDRLRHSATSALFERRDVIVVSSVSCLYGLGDPIDYKSMVISLRVGNEYPLDDVLRKLAEIRYERNDIDFSRNKFRLRGDTLEIYPAYWSGKAIRVEFFGDEVDRISEINAVTGMAERYLDHVAIYPASHYVASSEKLHRAMMDIRRECDEQVAFFRAQNKLVEAQRIAQRIEVAAFHEVIDVDDHAGQTVDVFALFGGLHGRGYSARVEHLALHGIELGTHVLPLEHILDDGIDALLLKGIHTAVGTGGEDHGAHHEHGRGIELHDHGGLALPLVGGRTAAPRITLGRG